MRRLATILMVIAAILIGGMTPIDAMTVQTTKTTARTSKAFTAQTLLKRSGDLINFNTNIGSRLVKAGFSKNGNTYTRAGINVVLNLPRPTQIKITFSSSSDIDKFINQSKSLGYIWSGRECVNGWEKAMGASVEGNTITLTLIP